MKLILTLQYLGDGRVYVKYYDAQTTQQELVYITDTLTATVAKAITDLVVGDIIQPRGSFPGEGARVVSIGTIHEDPRCSSCN